jgi:hypothetical protein
MPCTICWWPINTEQVVVVLHMEQKISSIAILSDVSIDRGVDKP